MNAIDRERALERGLAADEYVDVARPLQIARNESWWALANDASDSHTARAKKASKALSEALADKKRSATFARWRKEAPTGDAVVDRRVDVIAREIAATPTSKQERAAISDTQTSLQQKFASHRAIVGDTPHSAAELDAILTGSRDVALRERAWRGAVSAGEALAPTLLELVRKRNAFAQRQGYRDFYAMRLDLTEIDEDELFSMLDTLEKASRSPYRTRKAVHDADRARQFGCNADSLKPWHYEDPFFQRVRAPERLGLSEHLEDLDFIDAAVRFNDSLGFNVRDVIERSDIYPREAKNGHAFCMDVNRSGDIRVLLNLTNSERWLQTTLHELGHAAYDRYIPRSLPWELRRPTHAFVTESIAMLMDRQAFTSEFLIEYAGLDPFVVTPLSGELRRFMSFRKQLMVRWCLVMIHFERALYADPDRADLDAYWWELRQKFQLVNAPENPPTADWAAKPHFTIAPVYYHNYLLGDVLASQLAATIATQSRQPTLVDNSFAGEMLIGDLFRHGAALSWRDLVQKVTKEPLNVDAFVREYLS
ncbi:MAG: peptidyl-dipeptidase A [Bradymonadia bacterium]|jgi:peptidyl-dipeptidase A